ncbi:MAG: mechanosensitive ion channel [Alphaproteobacteria bacterium]
MEENGLIDRLFDPAHWQRFAEASLEWAQTELLVPSTIVQFAVVVAAWAVARFLAPKMRGVLEGRIGKLRPVRIVDGVIKSILPLVLPLIWLLLQWFSVFAAQRADWPHHIVESAVSLLTAWVVIRLMAGAVRNPGLSRTVAVLAWGVAALNLLGLLDPTMATLDSMGVTLGEVRISVLGAIKAGIMLAVLLWLAGILSRLTESRLAQSHSLSPSARVLLGKTVRISLLAVAFVLALDSIGIDFTALAVFSGAVGLGVGFGLQKVVSNLISGLILLMDKSVKPGDVIAIGDTFGWINSLRARYVSVITRDGTEHLIPNEELISQRVENWSYSDTLVRLKIPIGISYDSDPRLAMELAVKAAEGVDRVRDDPAPVARFMNLGSDAVELELRIWINDPQAGVVNVRSAILMNVWDSYHENGISFPYSQRDLHIKSSVPIPVEIAGDKPGQDRP